MVRAWISRLGLGSRRVRIALWLGSTVAAASLTAAVLVAVRSPSPAAPSPPAPGQGIVSVGFVRLNTPAKAFRLPRLDGHGSVSLAQLAGRPVVLNFWSSTCTVCRTETPALATVARGTHGKVAFVGVDTLDARGAARAFVARYHVPYPVAFDPRGSAAGKYGVPALPVTFFLSRDGQRVLGANAGALSVPRLTAILRTLYGVS